jgi:hypothetical protein
MSFSKTERIERIRILLGHLTVEEVLAHYDVEILDRVDSRKGGTELVGPCPFHPTNSPNFYFNDENARFFCRSAFCGKKGDLITFVALKEGCVALRAYEILCEIAGIDSSDVNPLAITMSVLSQIGRRRKSDALISASPIPLPHGYKVLPHPYFVPARGIAPGVLVEAKSGGVVGDDFYKYRACVPIYEDGKLWSLYSRSCGPTNLKHHYSGSSLTSRLLYGLDVAAQGGEVILVEAIISVLKLRTLGVHNAVAMLGSGVSDQQVLKMIEHKRKITRIVVCSDNDEKTDPDTGETFNPGMKAAWNSYRRLSKFFDVGVAKLPVNRDPADMDDRDEFENVLDHVLWPSGRTKTRQEIERFFYGGKQ